MAWFKKTTIKRMTNKRATMLWNGMIGTLNANPNMDQKQALIEYIQDTLTAGAVLTAPHESYSSTLEGPFEFLNKAKHDKELQWQQLFCLMTARLVFDELSYDPTIGTREDFGLVSDIVYDLLGKWASS